MSVRNFVESTVNWRILKAMAQAKQSAVIEFLGVDLEGKKIDYSQVLCDKTPHPSLTANPNQRLISRNY